MNRARFHRRTKLPSRPVHRGHNLGLNLSEIRAHLHPLGPSSRLPWTSLYHTVQTRHRVLHLNGLGNVSSAATPTSKCKETCVWLHSPLTRERRLVRACAQVVARGGFANGVGKRGRIKWARDVFPCMKNYTSSHRMTSVGHDLINHYKTLLVRAPPGPTQPTNSVCNTGTVSGGQAARGSA